MRFHVKHLDFEFMKQLFEPSRNMSQNNDCICTEDSNGLNRRLSYHKVVALSLRLFLIPKHLEFMFCPPTRTFWLNLTAHKGKFSSLDSFPLRADKA
jgi:hypothetical protein